MKDKKSEYEKLAYEEAGRLIAKFDGIHPALVDSIMVCFQLQDTHAKQISDVSKKKACGFIDWIESDECPYYAMEAFGKKAWINEHQYIREFQDENELEREHIINKGGITTSQLYDIFEKTFNKS